jgi:hypothetical protein
MGIYDNVKIEKGVELPEFPEERDKNKLDWQTKDISGPAMRTFKITENGRLLRKEEEKREMTKEERDEMAREHGFDSWELWEEADTKMNEPLQTWKYTVEDEWWADYNMHGSLEFHASGSRVEGFEDFYWSYEARYTRGELQEIVFMGERLSDNLNPPREE